MSTTRISDIIDGEEAKPIEVRVIRKWKPLQQKTDFCYLFVDIHGDAIQVTASMSEESRFNSIIIVQSCYIVDRYIALPQKTHNPAVPHRACLRIGRKAKFMPTTNDNIPDHYYNFATFSDLELRTKPPRMLTDYIGRIENIKQTITGTGKKLKKVKIQDTRENLLEITFWPDQSSILPHDIKEGDILAITSTVVTMYRDALELETTSATTVVINPTTPDTLTYTSRLKRLAQPKHSRLTIADLFNKSTMLNTHQNRYTCLAMIKELHSNRHWYYVVCPKCSKKMHLQKVPCVKFECENDENVEHPKFMYCVNAIIVDDTSTAKAVFFNEAMTELLNITCEEMVITHGYFEESQIPEMMYSIIGSPKIMTVTINPNLTLTVNSIRNPPAAIQEHSTDTETLTMPPMTPSKPSTKMSITKRKEKDARNAKED